MWNLFDLNRHIATAGVFALAATGCGDAVLDANGAPVLNQAAVTGFAIGPSNQFIDEGDTSTVIIQQLCTDGDVPGLVDVGIDWADGSAPDGFTIPVGAVPGGGGTVCPGGGFVVCDASNPGHPNTAACQITHTYADNGSFNVQASASHASAFSLSGLTVDVANLPPVITSFTRSAGAVIEGEINTYSLTAGDPGLLATELASVTWTFTPADSIENPTTVICTCATNTCVDQGGAIVAGGDNVCTESIEGTLSSARSRRILDDGSITVSVTLLDKDNASTSATAGPTTFFNQAPSNLELRVSGPNPGGGNYLNTVISDDVGNPTEVIEGSLYNLAGDFDESGTDTATVLWDFDGDLSSDASGTASVTKASYPNLLDPLGSLTPAFTWDDSPAVDYQVRLEVQDTDALPAVVLTQETRQVTVIDVDPVIDTFTRSVASAPEGTTVQFNVVAISGAEDESFDPIDPAGYTWFVDGNAINGSTVVAGEFQVAAGCTSSSTSCTLLMLDDDVASSHDVFVRASDEDSDTDSGTLSVGVTNVLPTISTFSASPIGINEGSSTTVNVTMADPAAVLDATYTLTITWGDGDSDTRTLASPGAFAAVSHTYADNDDCAASTTSAPCTVSVQVCEDTAPGTVCSTTSNTTLTVSNVAPTVAIANPTAIQTLVEGEAFDLNGSFDDLAGDLDESFAFEWEWLEGNPNGSSTYADRTTGADLAGGGRFDDVGAAGLTNSPLTLTVMDEDLGSTTATVLVDVRDNVPELTIDGVVLDNSSDEPATPTLTVDFAAETDADAIARIRVSWGDGSTETFTAGIAGTLAAGVTDFDLVKSTPYADNGTFTISVSVDDEDSTTTRTTSITVDNVAPTIVSINPPAPGPVIVSEGQAAAFVVTSTDVATPDRAGLITSFTWGDGSAVELQTGALQGANNISRAAHVYPNPGTFTVTIFVTDKDGGQSASQQIQVEVVNVQPTITDIFTNGPIPEGVALTAVTLVDNRGADPLAFAYNFNCSTSTPTDADFVLARPGGQASAVAQNTYADNGSVTVCVRVCDDDGASNSCDFASVAASITNAEPSIVTLTASGPVSEGGTSTINATATDLGGVNDPLTFSVDCNDDGAAEFAAVPALCSYPRSGTFTARVTVSDGDGGTASRTIAVNVGNVAPTLGTVAAAGVAEGSLTNFVITGSSDAGGDALVHEIDVNADGIFDLTTPTGNAQFRYTTDGLKTFVVRVCDSEGSCSPSSGPPTPSPTFTTTITNTAPTVTLNAPTSSTAGSAVTVSANATDPGSDTLAYRFVFALGATTVATVGPQASNVATATLPDSGTYTVTVSVSDQASAPNTVATTTATANIVVTDLSVNVTASANPNPVDEGGSTVITVIPLGTGPYLVSYDLNADGDFGDAEDIVDDACAGNVNDPCRASTSFANNRPNNIAYRLLVSVTDQGAADAVSTAIVSVEVENVGPTLAAVGDSGVLEGEQFSTTLAGDDIGAEDTLSYSLVSGPEAMEVDEVTGELTWSPTFTDVGFHEITVRVTDSDGGSADETFGVTVNMLDDNGNEISDNQERALNDGELFPAGSDVADSDGDRVTDAQELLAGTNPAVSDAPTAPVIISPVRDERVATTTPQLAVANARSPRGRPLSYTFIVVNADDEEVARVEGVAEGSSTTTADIDDADVVEGARFEWFAFADDGLVDGANSQRGSFIVDTTNEAPAAPAPLAPANDAAFTAGTMPSLEVRAVVDGDDDDVSYVFEVATASTFADGTVVITSEPRDVPFFTVTTVLAPGTYFWRAHASDGELEGAFSEVRSFSIVAVEVNEAPPAPGIDSPTGDVAATTVLLTVGAVTDPDGDAVQYEFELADNPAFAAPAALSGAQAARSFEVNDLDEDTAYFWRARAFDGALYSDWVSASFTVDAQNGAPTGLLILSPVDGALLMAAPTSFVVQTPADPEGDALQVTFTIANDAELTDVVLTETIAGTEGSTTWTPAELTLDKGKTYTWSVSVSDGTSTVDASASFQIYKAPEQTQVPPESSGCGCASSQPSGVGVAWIGLVVVGLLRRRRR